MSFCTGCGCQRTGANLYCDGCGAEFAESARSDAPETVASSGAGGSWAAPWSDEGTASQLPSGTATGPDLGVGLLDSLLTVPDPRGDAWRDYAVAGQANRPPGRRNWIAIVAVAVVLIAGLGGAAAFELGHGQARPGAKAARASGAAAHSVARRPAPSAASSADSSLTDVTVAPAAAGNAALPQVIALLHGYFSAIDQHDYAAYTQLLDPQVLQRTSAAAFSSGDGTTTDSDVTLTGLAGTGSGGLAAAVTFTSQQQPADSPDHSACDDWSITLYLVPQGAGYLIGAPPSGYEASYTSC